MEHGEFAVRGEVLDVDVKALGAIRIFTPGQEVARGGKRHAPHRRVAPVEFGIQVQEDPVRHGVGEDLGCVGSDWRIGDVDLDEKRVACPGGQYGQEPGVSDASGRAEFPREHLRGGKPEQGVGDGSQVFEGVSGRVRLRFEQRALNSCVAAQPFEWVVPPSRSDLEHVGPGLSEGGGVDHDVPSRAWCGFTSFKGLQTPMSREVAIRCPMVNGMACYFRECVGGGILP